MKSITLFFIILFIISCLPRYIDSQEQPQTPTTTNVITSSSSVTSYTATVSKTVSQGISASGSAGSGSASGSVNTNDAAPVPSEGRMINTAVAVIAAAIVLF